MQSTKCAVAQLDNETQNSTCTNGIVNIKASLKNIFYTNNKNKSFNGHLLFHCLDFMVHNFAVMFTLAALIKWLKAAFCLCEKFQQMAH